MDLSFLKWPCIILVIIGGGWLLTAGGVNYMYGKFTAGTPGADANSDTVNEAGLSKLGNYCLKTFQYEKAMMILSTACERYPQGANYYHNQYRMAKCAEKTGNVEQSVAVLRSLIAINANSLDDRVPNNDILQARADKLEAVNNT